MIHNRYLEYHLVLHLSFKAKVMKNLTILIAVLVLSSCSINSNKDQTSSKEAKSLPANPNIELETTVKNKNTINFLIITNIPLPVEFMVSIALKGQKPDETYIGASKKIKFESSPYSFDFDISEYKLPNGEYNAEVTFYPQWGADNGNELAKKINTKIMDSTSINLKTVYGSADERKEIDKKQIWVMDNVIVGTIWNADKFIENIGKYQELKVTNKNAEIIKVYYFPEADMTIFVSKPKKSVLTWRIGKTDAL